MENKPQNVFEKLDRQEEKIDDISSKLEGISINDLYALAKRTWDYGDYQTAQKYYNHISLLKPLDWETPLYASLCNFKGYHDMFFWTKVPEQVEKIIISTFEYISNLDLDNSTKEYEMSRCIEIIKKEMQGTIKHYFDYEENYNEEDSSYVYTLEDYFVNVYQKIKNIDLKCIKQFMIVIVEDCCTIIKGTERLSPNITKEIADEMLCTSGEYFNNYEDIIASIKKYPIEPIKELSNQEKNEIMLKGTMYFEYNDKVISNRYFVRNMLLGSILSVLSIVGIVISFLGKCYWMFAFVFPLFYGFLLVIRALTQKDKIKCSSLLSGHRIKNRLTSDGNVTQDNKFNFMRLITLLGLYLVMFVGVFMAIATLAGEEVSTFAIVFVILDALTIITYFTSLKGINEHQSKFNGKYIYLYKGKYYNLK